LKYKKYLQIRKDYNFKAAQIFIFLILKESLLSLLLTDLILGAPKVSFDELDFTLFCFLYKLPSFLLTLLK